MRALFRSDPLGVATVIIAVCAIGAAAMMASRSAPPPASVVRPTTNPAATELARCRTLGEAGGADPRCHAAWAESRRRFFGGGERP